MPVSKTTWKKGQSGNPRGRPPKQRALSEILEKRGNVTAQNPQDPNKKIAAKRLVAEHVWNLLATGRTDFASGKSLEIGDVGEYVQLLKFMYEQVDGKAKTQVELSGEDGGPVGIKLVEVVLDASVAGGSDNPEA